MKIPSFDVHTPPSKPQERFSVKHVFAHPSSRRRDADLVTGRRGRTSPRGAGTMRRAAMSPTTRPKDHEAAQFAGQLTEHLRLAHARNHFESLVLVAPPHFLGQLRSGMVKPVARAVMQSWDKDYAQMPDHEMVAMAEQLAGAGASPN